MKYPRDYDKQKTMNDEDRQDLIDDAHRRDIERMDRAEYDREVAKDEKAAQKYMERKFLKDWCRINRMPLPDCMGDIVCRGCKELGTACGKCSKCTKEQPQ